VSNKVSYFGAGSRLFFCQTFTASHFVNTVYLVLRMCFIASQLPQRSTYLHARVNWHSLQCRRRCSRIHLYLGYLRKYMNLAKLVKQTQSS